MREGSHETAALVKGKGAMANRADPDDAARHAEKKARIKAARDRMMAEKTGEKGLILVLTGPGKGKSSSAFGMVMRAISHGMRVGVVQFIKGTWDTGERRLLTTHFSDLCQFHSMGEGFTWETQDKARDIAAAEAGILEHVNADHPDAVAAIAGTLAGAVPAETPWRLVGVDVDGCDLAAGEQVARLDFTAPVADAGGVRTELVRAARAARG